MKVFKLIAVEGASYVFVACSIVLFWTFCIFIGAAYWFNSGGLDANLFGITCFGLGVVALETVFVAWLISNVKKCNRNLQDLHDEWETIYNNSQVGIAFLKGGRVFAKGNRRLAEIFGYDSADEIEGADLRSVHLSEESYKEFGEKYYSILAYGSRLHIEYQLVKKDGTPVWCSLSGKAIDKAIPANLDKGVVWIIDDISKRKKLEEDLRSLAETDELTGLKNRRSFMLSARVEFERFGRYSSPLSIVMIDIDHFKAVNDRYGHAVGDIVLKKFADICREQFRGLDVVGRLGGEEFAILLPVTSSIEAVLIAERLRSACKKIELDIGGENLTITASFGVACAEEYSNVQSLLSRADKALYQAKRAGRDMVKLAEDDE